MAWVIASIDADEWDRYTGPAVGWDSQGNPMSVIVGYFSIMRSVSPNLIILLGFWSSYYRYLLLQ